jgi:hypothetical protein
MEEKIRIELGIDEELAEIKWKIFDFLKELRDEGKITFTMREVAKKETD